MSANPQQQRPFRPLRELLARRQNESVAVVSSIPNFLTPEQCQAIIDAARQKPPEQGAVGSDRELQDPVRRSDIWAIFPSPNTEWLFSRLEQAIQQLNKGYGFDLQGFYEGAQVARYEAGGHYDWHIDLGPGVFSSRKLSLSVHLSPEEDYEGGELDFMATGDETPRTQGLLTAFPSYLVHRVRPVTRGARFSLVSWISGPPFR